jgi:hypothetical protein
MLVVPKPGHNQWRLIIDLRELNRYCSEFPMICETLKHLHHMSRPGDYFVSLDLTDGYYTLGIRERKTISRLTTAIKVEGAIRNDYTRRVTLHVISLSASA